VELRGENPPLRQAEKRYVKKTKWESNNLATK